MAETKNLPSNLLSVQSRKRFLSEISKGQIFTLQEERRLSNLPVPQIRKHLTTKLLSLEGRPLTRPECDACLKFLALTLPRATLSPKDAHDMMDVYFGLLREAGVTGGMLTSACKAYVMRPNSGAAKFFPDPGQLVEICATDAAQRKRAIRAAQSALAVLEDKPAAADDTGAGRGRLIAFGEIFKAFRPTVVTTPPRPAPEEPRGPSLAEVRGQLAQDRDPAAVERLRNLTKTAEQA